MTFAVLALVFAVLAHGALCGSDRWNEDALARIAAVAVLTCCVFAITAALIATITA